MSRKEYTPGDSKLLKQILEDTYVDCPQKHTEELSLFEIIDYDLCCPICSIPLSVTIIENRVIASWIKSREIGRVIISTLPELPDQRRIRFQEEYGLQEEESVKLTSSKERADLFECLASPDTTQIVVDLVDELIGELEHRGRQIDTVEPDDFYPLVDLVRKERVTDKQITDIMRKTLDSGRTAGEVFDEGDYSIAETSEVEETVKLVISEEQSAVEDYKSGKENAINHLVGQVMEKEDGADPTKVRELLEKHI